MPFSGFYVCAACKPRAVAKIARGEPVGWIWRDRMRLVTLRNGLFPDRCVRCNEPALGVGVKRNFYWHHPAFYLLLLIPPFSLLLYVLVAVIVRKRSKSFVPLCEVHKWRRLRVLLICAGVFVAGVLGIVVL
ncbi:MAG TPA: hypothetical protein VFG14_18365, partial [Chthoniobacteraceae bacterium]|nr:hypothetical protein [Chthoniobacteraceae bacterium]